MVLQSEAAPAETRTPEPQREDPFIYCENLVKIYKVADLEAVALQGLDLQIQRGELMSIIGNSGSGKSTLLNILGGLDRPSAGRVSVAGRDLLKMSGGQFVRYKREVVGFVWQQTGRNMLPYLTAIENVELPMVIAGRYGKAERAWARELLEVVGLTARMTHKLSELSGGEQQRVAIAIGLANRPPLLLADEPTGSVDTKTAATIFELFRHIRDQYGTTIVVVTHDPKVMSKVDRVVAIRDGKTSSETVRRVAIDMADFAQGNIVLGETHDEFVVLDTAGRLQIPREYLDRLSIKKKVRLELDGDQIIIRSAAPEDDQEPVVTAPPTIAEKEKAPRRWGFR
jgi:ABC-type lipoprotein export system ATPase subunit/bifunctional DNA-binding transcriptional regulator/antitoxin component of YhaV-PrlF toxin-antitoxin module